MSDNVATVIEAISRLIAPGVVIYYSLTAHDYLILRSLWMFISGK